MKTNSKKTIEGNSPEAQKVLCKALMKIARMWELEDPDLGAILGKDRTQIPRWREKGVVPMKDKHLKEALQHFLAVYRSLGTMFQEAEDQREWLVADHKQLGVPPLSLMKESMKGLIEVRTYLDYIRGRGA